MTAPAPPAAPLAARPLPRFTFLVHSLAPLHRIVMGVRGARPLLASGLSDGTSFDDVFELCTLRLDGVAEGIILGSALDPRQMLEDQQRALRRLERGAALARDWAQRHGGPLGAVGLGSLCAVVAGRGTALAERVPEPVTTGGAATAWSLWRNTHAVLVALAEHGVSVDVVAILGSRSPVGAAVAQLLTADGLTVRLDSPRAARRLPKGRAEAFDRPEDAIQGCRVVVGAGPTGGTVSALALAPGTVVIDVAIPPTFTGPRPAGVVELAGEALSLPSGWTRGFWGQLYHVVSGYGPRQVYACLIEPLVLAHLGLDHPLALGRRLDVANIQAFGAAAHALGFAPRLARGWWSTPARQLAAQSRRHRPALDGPAG